MTQNDLAVPARWQDEVKPPNKQRRDGDAGVKGLDLDLGVQVVGHREQTLDVVPDLRKWQCALERALRHDALEVLRPAPGSRSGWKTSPPLARRLPPATEGTSGGWRPAPHPASRRIRFKRKTRRKATVDEAERYLTKRAAPLHALPVKEINRAIVSTLLNKVEAEFGFGTRNNTRAYTRAFFTWLRKEGYVDTNPVTDTNAAESSSRVRLPTDGEVKAILTALSATQRVDADFPDIVRLLFGTGLRRDEAAKLEWDEVYFDDAMLIIRAPRMKNHKDHMAPLSDALLAMLKDRYDRLDLANPRKTVFGRRDTGFSGFSKTKRELDAAAMKANGRRPIAPWTHHDIRRYVSTTLNERLGVEPPIVEVVLSHYPKGVAGIYNRAQYVDEKRHALDRLADHLHALATGKASVSKVVTLRKR
jgi:integrase